MTKKIRYIKNKVHIILVRVGLRLKLIILMIIELIIEVQLKNLKHAMKKILID